MYSQSSAATPTDTPQSSQRLSVPVLALVGLTLVALYSNAHFLFEFLHVKQSWRCSWAQFFQWERPEFQAAFWQQLGSFSWPGIYSPEGRNALVFAIVLGLVFWHGLTSKGRRTGSRTSLIPAFAPALAGLTLAPLDLIPPILALAKQGLQNPHAAGDGVAHATLTIGVGLLLSLISVWVIPKLGGGTLPRPEESASVAVSSGLPG